MNISDARVSTQHQRRAKRNYGCFAYSDLAELLRTVDPATAALLRRGKCQHIIIIKMRSLAREAAAAP